MQNAIIHTEQMQITTEMTICMIYLHIANFMLDLFICSLYKKKKNHHFAQQLKYSW